MRDELERCFISGLTADQRKRFNNLIQIAALREGKLPKLNEPDDLHEVLYKMLDDAGITAEAVASVWPSKFPSSQYMGLDYVEYLIVIEWPIQYPDALPPGPSIDELSEGTIDGEFEEIDRSPRKERVMKWDEWFFEIAKTISLKSKDPSYKVGCIVVGPEHEVRATGYNGFPRGSNDSIEIYNDRPRKYLRVVHAEANAVANASFTGTTLRGGIAYVTLPPCADCAGLMVNAGICSVNFLVPLDNPNGIDERWRGHFVEALEIFEEVGVDFVGFSGEWDEDGCDPREAEIHHWFVRMKEGTNDDQDK